ncbi:MAG: hypothetical protein ABSE16_09680 [Verrucomicrobiota bacterium]|jgi:hypothetical protein
MKYSKHNEAKTFASIFLSSVLLLGCSRPAEIKYQTGTLESWRWNNFTNYTLFVNCTYSHFQTNVDTLDQAANILGQYGWELVNSETVGGREVYHLKRQIRDGDGCDFIFTPNVDLSREP